MQAAFAFLARQLLKWRDKMGGRPAFHLDQCVTIPLAF
jgi:hypothetical protein